MEIDFVGGGGGGLKLENVGMNFNPNPYPCLHAFWYYHSYLLEQFVLSPWHFSSFCTGKMGK